MPQPYLRAILVLLLELTSCRVSNGRRPVPQASIASTNNTPPAQTDSSALATSQAVVGAPTKNKACEPCGHGVVYGPRFANAQRNSLARACLCSELKRKIDVAKSGSAMHGFVFTGESPDWLGTSTPIISSGYNASVDLRNGVITPANVHVLSDDRLAMFWYDGYKEAPIDAKERERIATMNLPPPPVLAYYATPKGFIQARFYYAEKSPPCPPGARCSRPRAKKEGILLEFYDFTPGILEREAVTYDASLPPATQPKVPKWTVRLRDCLDEPVFLNDGTAVVPCVYAVRWVTTEGKESRTFPTRLMHGRVSVDLDNHVVGFESAGKEPQFAHIGSQQTLLSLGHIIPSQPPIALPGDRVVVLTGEEVISIRGNAVEWRVKVARPERYASGERMFDNQPNALGTLDGKVVVRWAGLVYALDERGEEVWRMNLDEPIVSNVVLTANGGVCVALNRSVHCELPE